MRTKVAFIGCALLLGFATGASAQGYLGAGSCGGSECHTKRELTWWSRDAGGKEHKNSLALFERAADKSKRYADTVKLADFMDPKGMCMQCHGTPQLVGGEREGVGCEGCHNPAAKYKPYHASNSKPENYKQSVSLGMADLKRNTKAWVKVCTDCHVLDGKPQYDALTGDGHPDGRRWNIGVKYAGVSKHWKPTTAALYTAEKVVARAAVGDSSPAGGEPTKPDPPKVDPPKVDPPKVDPTKKDPPKVDPPKVDPPKVDPTRKDPPKVDPPRRDPPRVDPPKLTVNPPPVDPDPRPSMMRGSVSPLSLPTPPPTTAAEMLAALQSRVAGYLTQLLRDGVSPAQPLKPLPTPRITGVDAELLQLQAEALALAVEALNLRVKSTAKPPDK